jgi:hypothetical protein
MHWMLFLFDCISGTGKIELRASFQMGLAGGESK